MSYPLSSNVNVGDPTEASQYNNLRRDALFLGGESGASGSVRDLMIKAAGPLEFVQVGKTGINLTASETEPVGIMIGGIICTITETIQLQLSADLMPTAGRYSIYATAGASGDFALAVYPGENSRAVGTFLWTGTGIIPGTVRTMEAWRSIQASRDPAAAHGRLSLAAGNPLPDVDIANAEQIYFLPYNGKLISLYLFGTWEYFEIGILSLAVGSMQQEIPYDIFLGANEDGLFLTAHQWANAAERVPGALTRVDGIRVDGGNNGLRLLGTAVINSSGYAEDSRTGRLLWNENNRRPRPLLDLLTTEQTEGGTTENKWIPYFGLDAPEVRMIIPDEEAEFQLAGTGIGTTVASTDLQYRRAIIVGICLDMEMVSPYTGNTNAAPGTIHSLGNTGCRAELYNFGAAVRGYHRFTLGFFTNYTFKPQKEPDSVNLGGVCPGLTGWIRA